MEKYNGGHLKKEVRTNVTPEEREMFKKYCESIGKSPTEVLREYVLRCIGEDVIEP